MANQILLRRGDRLRISIQRDDAAGRPDALGNCLRMPSAAERSVHEYTSGLRI